MSAGIFTTNLRFTFVEKTTEEVGAGTIYPMLVKLDQLAEIDYRVKDAWFTSGIVSTITDYGEGPVAGVGLSMTGATPPTQLITGDGYDQFYIRGYCWWGNYLDLHADNAAYFGSPYGPDILPGAWPFATEYLADYFPPTVEPWTTNGESLYRDMGDNERGIWLPEKQNIDPTVNETAKINGATTRTGFSHEISEYSNVYIYHSAPSQLRLEIYPEVAWVDENLSGNPYDPSNKLYLKMRFGVLGTASPGDVVALDTMPDSAYASYIEACNLVFQLSNSTCTAQIYFYNLPSNATLDYATDFVITAKEWWPYAKDSPAVPVWNTATGTKL